MADARLEKLLVSLKICTDANQYSEARAVINVMKIILIDFKNKELAAKYHDKINDAMTQIQEAEAKCNQHNQDQDQHQHQQQS